MSLSASIKRGGVALRTKAAVRLPHKGRPPCTQSLFEWACLADPYLIPQ
jgi:hypothetical protein